MVTVDCYLAKAWDVYFKCMQRLLLLNCLYIRGFLSHSFCLVHHVWCNMPFEKDERASKCRRQFYICATWSAKTAQRIGFGTKLLTARETKFRSKMAFFLVVKLIHFYSVNYYHVLFSWLVWNGDKYFDLVPCMNSSYVELFKACNFWILMLMLLRNIYNTWRWQLWSMSSISFMMEFIP